MFEELNEQLARVKELQQKRQQWNHQLANYQLEIEEKQQTMVDLEEKIEAYRAEREKLDKITFVHLKAILTGSKDEKIYEKRNQITDAQYDYDEMQQAVSSIEVLIKGIQENINALPDIDSEYQNIMKQKEKLVMDAHPLLANQYVDLNEKITELESTFQKYSKANKFGKSAETSLATALKSLSKAQKLSSPGSYNKSGAINSLRDQHIMNAKASIQVAQTKIRKLHKLLKAMHKDFNLSIDIQGLLTSADSFFDRIFIDTVIHEQVHEALDKVQNQQNEIMKINHHLSFRYKRQKSELENLYKRKKSLLEDAEDW